MKNEVQSGKRLLAIDSRPGQEYNDGHLPGAINIDPPRFVFIAGLLPKDKTYPLVFYCRGYG